MFYCWIQHFQPDKLKSAEWFYFGKGGLNFQRIEK